MIHVTKLESICLKTKHFKTAQQKQKDQKKQQQKQKKQKKQTTNNPPPLNMLLFCIKHTFIKN